MAQSYSQPQSQPNRYLQTSAQTATPSQLLIMLCDGAIRFNRLGIEALKQNKFGEAHTNLCKTQDIIKEFMLTLDSRSSVSDGLMKLYDYFLRKLVEANTKKDAEPAEEVLGFLLELKETWIQASKAVLAEKSGVKHG